MFTEANWKSRAPSNEESSRNICSTVLSLVSRSVRTDVQAAVPVGEDGLRARPQEPGRVPVRPLLGGRLRGQRPARLRVPGGVAQVVQQDDGVRGERQLAHVRLAVVLDVAVAVVRGGVEAHPVAP